MKFMDKQQYKPETQAIRLRVPQTAQREHSSPLYLTSSFCYDGLAHEVHKNAPQQGQHEQQSASVCHDADQRRRVHPGKHRMQEPVLFGYLVSSSTGMMQVAAHEIKEEPYDLRRDHGRQVGDHYEQYAEEQPPFIAKKKFV